MPQDFADRPERFQSLVDADCDKENLFEGLHAEFNRDRNTVAGLRRRRRRASNSPDSPIKTVSLVEEDGVLYLDASSSVAPISRYRLGCIEQKDKKVKLRSREPYSVEVNQAQQVRKRWTLPMFPHGGIDIHKCRDSDKFAIVEVEFSDGAVWKITVR